MEDMRDDICVVGYWSNVACVTTDKELAQKILTNKRGSSPALPWEIRNVEEALKHAYEIGFQDGLEEGEF